MLISTIVIVKKNLHYKKIIFYICTISLCYLFRLQGFLLVKKQTNEHSLRYFIYKKREKKCLM